MSKPTKLDLFAAPIQLAEMDLDPVRNVAKSTLVDLEILLITVRTGAAGFGSALFLLQTELQDLNDMLCELGFGDAPSRVAVFDAERKSAAFGLGLISGAVGSIREILNAGGLVADLESLEDQASLFKRGLQLLGDAPGAESVAESATKSVMLFGRQDGPIVKGRKKNTLTKAQYDVVLALLKADDKGLTKDQLDGESRHGDARKVLKRLSAGDPDWKSVISFPVTAGRGYRIL